MANFNLMMSPPVDLESRFSADDDC